MSRSTFLTTTSSFETSESPSLPVATTSANPNTDHSRAPRFHHRLMPTISASSRSNETMPVLVVQSSTTTTKDSTTTITTNSAQHKSVVRLNPRSKRNARDKRRATGIRPDEVLSASPSNDAAFDNDEEEDNAPSHSQFITITNTEPSESHDRHPISTPKPVFKVSRVQPTFDDNTRHSFDKLAISRADSFVVNSTTAAPSTAATAMFKPTEFIVRRQPSTEDSLPVKYRQLEERLRSLESLIYEKDSIIHDLQRKLDNKTRDLNDAEQQIYVLQRDKLTLIKALTNLDSNSSGGADHSTAPVRTGFISRN